MVLVQSPAEAAYREMPQSAIKYNGLVDLIAPIDLLAADCRLTGYRPEPQKHTEQPVNLAG